MEAKQQVPASFKRPSVTEAKVWGDEHFKKHKLNKDMRWIGNYFSWLFPQER